MKLTGTVLCVSVCKVKSFVTNCKSDTTDSKFHQHLQLTLTTIQLTVTRGGVLVGGVNENFTLVQANVNKPLPPYLNHPLRVRK